MCAAGLGHRLIHWLCFGILEYCSGPVGPLRPDPSVQELDPPSPLQFNNKAMGKQGVVHAPMHLATPTPHPEELRLILSCHSTVLRPADCGPSISAILIDLTRSALGSSSNDLHRSRSSPTCSTNLLCTSWRLHRALRGLHSRSTSFRVLYCSNTNNVSTLKTQMP